MSTTDTRTAPTEWTWLNDDYRAGTVFITDDPTGEQGAIAEGLRETVAERIVKAHNAVVEAAQLRLLSCEGQASEPPPRPIPPIGPGQDKKGGVPFPRRVTADRLEARSTPAEALDSERLRYILWTAHGHGELYGDDGEMQCSQCGPDWDYLRGDLPRLIERAYSAVALARLSHNEEPGDVARPVPGPRLASRASGGRVQSPEDAS